MTSEFAAAIIDIHAHVMPTHDESGKLIRIRPHSKNTPQSTTPRDDAEERVAWLDREGIDLQVLSAVPLTQKSKLTEEWCKRHNDLLASFVDFAPKRLRGFIQLPMHDIGAAVRELDRARGLGLVAPYILSDHGPELDDAAMDDFYHAVVERELPLVIHGGSVNAESRWMDPRMHVRPDRDVHSLRGRWGMSLVWGFIYEETLTAISLIYGGVLDRHPKLEVCVPHAGGTLPFIIGRLINGSKALPGVPDFLREDGAMIERVKRLWVDADLHDKRVLDFTIDVLGDEKIVLGTDFPNWSKSPLAIYNKSQLRLFSDNARRFLRL